MSAKRMRALKRTNAAKVKLAHEMRANPYACVFSRLASRESRQRPSAPLRRIVSVQPDRRVALPSDAVAVISSVDPIIGEVDR